MSRPALLIALTTVAGLAGVPQAEAGHGRGCWKPRPIVVHPPAPTIVHKPAVTPIGYVSPQPPVIAPQRAWYFGMSLQITHTAYGRGLQVASVTPGSPAQLAGLEPGDVLLTAGHVSLQGAYSNEHGVQLLQSAVGGSAPAPTAAASAYLVAPSPRVTLQVVNVRTHQVQPVSVQPIPSGGAPAPATAAPVASAAAGGVF